MIYLVDDVGPSPSAQSVAFRDLPLRDVGQHSLLSMYSLPHTSFMMMTLIYFHHTYDLGFIRF